LSSWRFDRGRRCAFKALVLGITITPTAGRFHLFDPGIEQQPGYQHPKQQPDAVAVKELVHDFNLPLLRRRTGYVMA